MKETIHARVASAAFGVLVQNRALGVEGNTELSIVGPVASRSVMETSSCIVGNRQSLQPARMRFWQYVAASGCVMVVVDGARCQMRPVTSSFTTVDKIVNACVFGRTRLGSVGMCHCA